MKLYSNLKKYPLILSLCVFFSWWIILFATSFLWRNITNSYSDYMLGYYLSTIVVVYLIYLFIIPSLFKIKFKNYFANIGLTINKQSIILSICFISSITLMSILRKPMTSIPTGFWLYSLQPPMVEELLFRGIIPYILFSKYNKKIAFSISIILFSCIHVLVGPITMLVALILGALFLILRFQCNSIIPCMLVHYIWNSSNAYAVILCLITIIIFEIYCFITRRSMKTIVKSL